MASMVHALYARCMVGAYNETYTGRPLGEGDNRRAGEGGGGQVLETFVGMCHK